MPEHIPTNTEKKCPACGSANIHKVPEGTDRPQTRRVEQLWSCEKCRNAFRLVEVAGDQRDPHFDC
jgi:transposase-like protein